MLCLLFWTYAGEYVFAEEAGLWPDEEKRDFWKVGGGLGLGILTCWLTLLFLLTTHAAEAINCLNAAIDIYTDMVRSCAGSSWTDALARDAAR